MEDFPAHHVHALSAHMEGLSAALESLPTDESAADSLRRLARSLASAAEEMGATALARAARSIRDAEDRVLDETTSAFLDHVRALRERETQTATRVLLVEDNRTIAAAVEAYLKGPGYQVYHAATAAEAERVLEEHRIDVVLLDLILPDRDGRDLLVQMRESRATASLPVIVMSGKEGVVAKAECLAVGAREFLEKPVDPKALRAALERHARPHREEGEAPGPADSVLDRPGLLEAFEVLRSDDRSRPTVAVLAVNDIEAIVRELGQEAGDGLVAAIGRELLPILDDREHVGRWERGVVVMLLPGTSAADAKRKLKHGLSGLASAGAFDGFVRAGTSLSFSAGVAIAESGQDLRDAVSAAKASLSRARAAGKGVVVTAEEAAPDRPPRVLLVEDDRVTATLVQHRLDREGFEVVDFDNGEDAHGWAADSDFDLAILDVKVPGMDGFELLERLRAIPRLESVPIVMLTGLGGEADVIRGLDLGANDYMLKPFSPTELMARVRRLLFPGAQGPAEGRGPRGLAEVGAR